MSLNIGILSSAYKAAAPSGTLLLDDYPGAAVAYSFRKLRSAYTGNCLRVRRSSDNTEIDIGFLNNVLNTTALLTFIGASNGNITIWYDQSGNGNNVSNTSLSEQPLIALSGVLITQNSLPSSFYNQNNLKFNTQINSDTNTSAYIVGKANSTITGGPLIGHDGPGGSGMFIGQNINGVYQINSLLNSTPSFGISNTNVATTNFCIQNGYITTVYNFFVNNTAISLPTQGTWSPSTNNFWNIGRYGNNFWTVGNISEVILYKSNQLSNRTGINGNINTFYTIF
jgi:hypothetical protein